MPPGRAGRSAVYDDVTADDECTVAVPMAGGMQIAGPGGGMTAGGIAASTQQGAGDAWRVIRSAHLVDPDCDVHHCSAGGVRDERLPGEELPTVYVGGTHHGAAADSIGEHHQ